MDQVQKAKQIVVDIQRSLILPPGKSVARSSSSDSVDSLTGKLEQFGLTGENTRDSANRIDSPGGNQRHSMRQIQQTPASSSASTLVDTPVRPIDPMLISPCVASPIVSIPKEFDSPSINRRLMTPLEIGKRRMPLSIRTGNSEFNTAAAASNNLGSSPPLLPPMHLSRPVLTSSRAKNSPYWTAISCLNNEENSAP